MRHVAIIGSGPAGFYTAEACLKQWGDAVSVDLIDRLPVPYGLIRSGVAPDHQSIKAVAKRFEAVALSPNVGFVGNIEVGRDLSMTEIMAAYDAVVVATGAPSDRSLGIPGERLDGVIGSAAFVGWYNGHPDFTGLNPPLGSETAAIIGNGNVALDVARILAKSPQELVGSDIASYALEALERSSIRRIVIVGRRGPHQIAMSPKELGELAHLARAAPRTDPADFPPEPADARLDPGQRKSVALLRSFARPEAGNAEVVIEFDFFARPIAVEGSSRVERLVVEPTRIDASGEPEPAGDPFTISCGLVVSCIGYRTPPLPGIPYDEQGGRFANREGCVLPGLYCVGWARRGPTGTIGSNRPDGFHIVERIAADQPAPEGKPGRAALTRLLAERGVAPTSFADWKRIEAAEAARARDGAPREKFTSIAEMLAARA